MPDVSLMPVVGMNNVSEDAALHRQGEEPSLQVRDAVNVDISPAGKLDTRQGVELVSQERYQNIWQSPLHGDVFATLGSGWGLLDMVQDPWVFTELADIGSGRVQHLVLNNLVAVCGPAGIFTYDGQQAVRLTISTPPAPVAVEQDEGALEPGTYGFAVAWLVGDRESGLSAMTSKEVQGGSVQLLMPMAVEQAATGIRVYMTKQNGGELLRQGDYPVGTASIDIALVDKLGEPARFRHLSPMPTGSHFAYWRGRLLTATANVLRFSEALTYHLHDERHGFIQMPQRITFVLPVDGGVWVGQVDHVAFLDGASPDEMSVQRKTSKAPVPFSAILARAEDVGGELSQGGMASAVWLADNGFVVGTATGQVFELHANKLKGISGMSGTTVGLDGRFTAAVT